VRQRAYLKRCADRAAAIFREVHGRDPVSAADYDWFVSTPRGREAMDRNSDENGRLKLE
jgi:hypothetical protein